jgi:hypothetical protein
VQQQQLSAKGGKKAGGCSDKKQKGGAGAGGQHPPMWDEAEVSYQVGGGSHVWTCTRILRWKVALQAFA